MRRPPGFRLFHTIKRHVIHYVACTRSDVHADVITLYFSVYSDSVGAFVMVHFVCLALPNSSKKSNELAVNRSFVQRKLPIK